MMGNEGLWRLLCAIAYMFYLIQGQTTPPGTCDTSLVSTYGYLSSCPPYLIPANLSSVTSYCEVYNCNMPSWIGYYGNGYYVNGSGAASCYTGDAFDALYTSSRYLPSGVLTNGTHSGPYLFLNLQWCIPSSIVNPSKNLQDCHLPSALSEYNLNWYGCGNSCNNGMVCAASVCTGYGYGVDSEGRLFRVIAYVSCQHGGPGDAEYVLQTGGTALPSPSPPPSPSPKACSGTYSAPGYNATNCPTTADDSCTIEDCDTGYHGTPSFNATCMANGTYSASPSGCEADIPCSGTYSAPGYNATSCPITAGDSCTIEDCDTGYHGTPSFDATCMANGIYSASPSGCEADVRECFCRIHT